MTRQESAILSAFTGILLGPMDAMHEYIEKLHGRPVFTHEMGSESFAEETKKLAEKDFIELMESIK